MDELNDLLKERTRHQRAYERRFLLHLFSLLTENEDGVPDFLGMPDEEVRLKYNRVTRLFDRRVHPGEFKS